LDNVQFQTDELKPFIRNLKNEFLIFHTPGRSHEGQYGLTNPELYFEKDDIDYLNQNLQNPDLNNDERNRISDYKNRKDFAEHLAVAMLNNDVKKVKEKHRNKFVVHGDNPEGITDYLPNK